MWSSVRGPHNTKLADQIKQHVPLAIRRKLVSVRTQPVRACRNIQQPPATVPASSAMAQHLVANPICADQCNADMFRILSRGRSSFNLRMLEATFILTTDPILCRQKELVRSLCLFQHGKQCDHSLAFFTRSWLFVVHIGVLVFYRFSWRIGFLLSSLFRNLVNSWLFSLAHLGIY